MPVSKSATGALYIEPLSLAESRAALGSTAEIGREALIKAMVHASKQVERATLRLVPVETGALRSAWLRGQPSQRPSGDVQIAMGYRGDVPSGRTRESAEGILTGDYALFQHEVYPVKRKPGRRWKYLSDPVDSIRGQMPDIASAFYRGDLQALGAVATMATVKLTVPYHEGFVAGVYTGARAGARLMRVPAGVRSPEGRPMGGQFMRERDFVRLPDETITAVPSWLR